jgi:hypothetical protein
MAKQTRPIRALPAKRAKAANKSEKAHNNARREVKPRTTGRVRIRNRPPSATPKNADDKVGYGNPPKATQFKPGQSGNPKGRPAKSRNLKTELREEISELITLREGEKIRKVPKLRAYVKRLSEQALKGDARATKLMLELIRSMFDDNPPMEAQDLSAADKELIEELTSTSSKSFKWGSSENETTDGGAADED